MIDKNTPSYRRPDLRRGDHYHRTQSKALLPRFFPSIVIHTSYRPIDIRIELAIATRLDEGVRHKSLDR